ncbi:Mu-like prophage major head subunit gpT family protein [Acetobacter malorum]|uniref:Mu-like prophage major head subunit gpT family protein n=1 Tax=Acetobacter malorum TaxID=178901 RepID=UPI0039E910C8
MDINIGNINALTATINKSFNKYIETAAPTFGRFTMTIPSTAGENFYPRLAEMPGLREWVGQRVIHRLAAGGFSIKNRTFEETLGIRREDLEDDQFGILSPAIEQLAADAAEMPDKLVYEALEMGVKTACMDGQYYFDTDHQTYNEKGALTGYSNLGVPQGTEAAGPAWYLFCTRRPLKPMIYQPRRPFVVTAKTQITAGNVFSGNEFLWGVDGRCNAGLGMYQFAYRSTRPLNGDTFAAALAEMASQRRKDGSPYGIRPDLLVVPQNLESAGRQLLNGDMVPVEAPDGKTWIPGANVWKGACDLLVAPRLSQKVGG